MTDKAQQLEAHLWEEIGALEYEESLLYHYSARNRQGRPILTPEQEVKIKAIKDTIAQHETRLKAIAQFRESDEANLRKLTQKEIDRLVDQMNAIGDASGPYTEEQKLRLNWLDEQLKSLRAYLVSLS